MDFGKRLKELRTSKNWTQEELAKKINLSKPNISKYEAGVVEPNLSTLNALCSLFNVSTDYLLYKTDFSDEKNKTICKNISRLIKTIKRPPNPGNIAGIELVFPDIQNGTYKFVNQTLEQFSEYFGVGISVLTNEPKEPTKSQGVKIPVLGNVAAGIPIEAIEDIIDYEEISEDMASRGEFFGLKIKGSSMEPRIKEGDVVIVRQQPDIESGDVAIVLVNGDSATCKKVVINEGGITLIPFNPTYEPQFYSAEQVVNLPVRIIGKVVELRGKF